MSVASTEPATGEFAGRVAIVTGSSSGIGEATARRLSALGASVVVNSSSSVEAGRAGWRPGNALDQCRRVAHGARP